MSRYIKEELENLILIEKKSYEEIGRLYGVSGVAIKKAAYRRGIDLPIRNRRTKNANEHFDRDVSLKNYGNCKNCGKQFIKYKQKRNVYCSIKCQNEYIGKEYIKQWKNGNISGRVGVGVSGHIKTYLFKKNNNKCEKCGWDKIHPLTNKVPLQVHHIDGDCTNCKEDNLELLCPNCHCLTDNYGNLNKNSTRGCSPRYLKKNKE